MSEIVAPDMTVKCGKRITTESNGLVRLSADETQACPIKRVGQGKKARVTLVFTPDAPKCRVLEAVEILFGDLVFSADISDRDVAFRFL